MQWLHKERSRLPLWLPVFYGVGIALQNYINNSFATHFLVCSLFTTTLSLVAFKKRTPVLYIIIPITFVVFGITIMQQHTLSKNQAPVIEADLGTIWVRGNLEIIEDREYGKRIWVNNLDLWQPKVKRFSVAKTPKRIRLNVRTKVEPNISPGDRIAFRAILSPPPSRSTYPDAYDFSFSAFYNEIGGTGFTTSTIKHYKNDKQRIHKFSESLRHIVTKNILKNAPEESQHIATALLTGKRGAIDKDVLTSIRNTGLGHLLAISGLHMALVMAGIFGICRIALSANQTICLHHNTKKIAATVAIAAGLLYLIVTGFPVSAQRAYIMTAIIFIAVLIDRNGISMRTLAFSALIVLTIAPHSLFTVSFQMSFAAVTALIAFFERPTPMLGSSRPAYSIFEKLTHTYHDDIIAPHRSLKFKKYIIGMVLSSTIAGLATMPFAVYHFGHVASYSVVANLFAIPLTSLWIMPWGVLSLISMPFGLEEYPLYPMHLGIQALLEIAEAINKWPDANTLVAHIPSSLVILFSFCALWVCNWQQTSLRLFGLIPITIYCLWYFSAQHRTPDFIIHENGALYAFKGTDDKFYFSSLQKARYARSQWLQMAGKKYGNHFRDLDKYAPETIWRCDNQRCFYETNGKKITLITLGGIVPSTVDCNQSFVVITPHQNTPCKQTKTITKADLRKNGTHALYLTYPTNIDNVESKKHHINNRQPQ
jgi:competence protein ComEC